MTREVQANRHRKARFLPDLGETLHQEAGFLIDGQAVGAAHPLHAL